MNHISSLLFSRKNGPDTATTSVAHRSNSTKRVGITAQEMPQPKPTSEHVYRFTAGRNLVLNSEVLGYDGAVAYRFVTEGKRMAMYDAADGREIASVLWGSRSRVTWEGVETKLGKFIFKNSGNTGRLFRHDGILYEWLQDMFFATVRTTPGAVRMAVIYNDKEKPEVELTPEGQAAGNGLLEQILLTTALLECRLHKDRAFTGSYKLNKVLASVERKDHTESSMTVSAKA